MYPLRAPFAFSTNLKLQINLSTSLKLETHTPEKGARLPLYVELERA